MMNELKRFRLAIDTKSYFHIVYRYIYIYMCVLSFQTYRCNACDLNAASTRGPFELIFHFFLRDPNFINHNLHRISFLDDHLHSGLELLLIRYITTLGLELWKQNETNDVLKYTRYEKETRKSEKTTITLVHHPNPWKSCSSPKDPPFPPCPDRCRLPRAKPVD